MTTAAEQFQIELYEEHLDEASFLYEQRRTLIHDPEVNWLDLKDFEDRHEAHIQGLLVGGASALEACLRQALDGDAGELHTVVTLVCRQNRFDLLEQIAENIDNEDVDKILAVNDALFIECPPGALSTIIELARSKNEVLATIAARLIGWRRYSSGLTFLDEQQALGNMSWNNIWSYGRLGSAGAISWLRKAFFSRDDPDLSTPALALLRLKDQSVIQRLAELAASEAWALVPLGLGGSRDEARALIGAARTSSLPGKDGLLALGLLGDIAAVDVLLDSLQVEDAAPTAAQALNLITGAERYEDVFVPDELDEDELFEDEIEKARAGETLTKADGTPYGVEIHRLSQNPEAWRTWWRENQTRFQDATRYRNGKPYGPGCLIENLKTETCPNRIRDLAHHELLIRYGADIPFELEMRIAEQQKAIAHYEAWLAENGSRFQDGQWYFNGRPM